MHSSSKRARVTVTEKSMPSYSESISISVCVACDSVRLARSHDVRRRRLARSLEFMLMPLFLRLNSFMHHCGGEEEEEGEEGAAAA